MFVMNVYIMIFIICDTLAHYNYKTEIISPNVGTVLFTQSDLNKKHWSKDKIKLLQARKHLQGIIPSPRHFGTVNEDYLNMLLSYFKESYKTVKREIKNSEINNMMNTALSDAIGGYFKVWVLPITKFAYYGGTISMEKAINVFKIFEDIKRNLNTDGHSWRDPDENLLKSLEINVTPRLRDSLTRSMKDPCKDLAYYEKTDTDLTIPLPVINWDIVPVTLFVPLKNQSIVPISSANSSKVLFNYYDIAENCMKAQNPVSSDNFKRKFQKWLSNEVAPHLNDDNLYIAFGNILSAMNDTHNFFGTISKPCHSEYDNVQSETLSEIKSTLHESPKQYLIIAIILLVELIWCLPSLFYVLRFKKSKRQCFEDNFFKFFKRKRGNMKLFSYYTQSQKPESKVINENKHNNQQENGVKIFIKPQANKWHSDVQPSCKPKYVSVKSSKSYYNGIRSDTTNANIFPNKSSLKKIQPEFVSLKTEHSIKKIYSRPDVLKLNKVTKKSKVSIQRNLEDIETLTISQDEQTIKEINYSQENTLKRSESQRKCCCKITSSKTTLNRCFCTSCFKDVPFIENIDKSTTSNMTPRPTNERSKRKEKKPVYQTVMHTEVDDHTHKQISDKSETKRDSNRPSKVKNSMPLLRIRIERPRTEIKVGITSIREHSKSKPSKIPRLAVKRETKDSHQIENEATTSFRNTERSKVNKIILRKKNLKDSTLDDTAIKRTSTINKKLNVTV